MRTRSFNPLQLDVEAFAQDGATLTGVWALSDLQRLCSSGDPQVPVGAADQVRWQLQGQIRAVRGTGPEIWLSLKAQTSVSMICQRCLQAMPVALDLYHNVQFVAGEDVAAALDAAAEDDVLALTQSLDAQALVEDELLLALPLVPRHDRCPTPLPLVAQVDAEHDKPHPFAALAQWKAGRNL